VSNERPKRLLGLFTTATRLASVPSKPGTCGQESRWNWRLGNAFMASGARACLRLDQKEPREARFVERQNCLARCTKVLENDPKVSAHEPKAAAWKVTVAAYMKERLKCSSAWLAQNLHLGVLDGASRYVGEQKIEGLLRTAGR